MTDRDRWISRHLQRLRLGQFLQTAGEWLAAFLIVFGVSVLLVKRLQPGWWPQVLWLAVAAVPVAWIAWRSSRRTSFTRSESVALLDRTLAAGGLLMTLTEVSAPEWNQHLPQLEERWRRALPRLRPRRFAAYLTLPLLFAIGVCFVPLRPFDAAELPPPVTAGQQAARRLEQLLATLQKADVLAVEQEQALAEEIRKLVEETKRAPLTHEKWETVDALEQKLRTELTKSQLQMDKLLAAANTLLQAGALEGLELTDEQLQQLEEELLETLMKREERSSGSTGSPAAGKDALQDLLQQLTKGGLQSARLPTDPEQRQQLLAELRDVLAQEQQRLAELRQAGEGGPPGAGQCAQCGGQCEHGQGLCGECQGNQPGQGGVGRGRGDAELTWGNESTEQGIRFKSVILPPGFEEDAKDEVMGVRLTAPKVEPAATAERAAERQVDPSTGRETWNRQLRPRHQSVVRDYFRSGGSLERSPGEPE